MGERVIASCYLKVSQHIGISRFTAALNGIGRTVPSEYKPQEMFFNMKKMAWIGDEVPILGGVQQEGGLSPKWSWTGRPLTPRLRTFDHERNKFCSIFPFGQTLLVSKMRRPGWTSLRGKQGQGGQLNLGKSLILPNRFTVHSGPHGLSLGTPSPTLHPYVFNHFSHCFLYFQNTMY